ncbi:MAG: CHAT domain-containing protein, partial [Saprospiraceae bacterium]|nr:CHAT domain-containing protein [Saprospiraceae bacterium]
MAAPLKLSVALFIAGLLMLFAGIGRAQSVPNPDSMAVRRLIDSAKFFYDEVNATKGLKTSREAYQLAMSRLGPNHVQTAQSAMYVAKGYRELDREKEALPFIEYSIGVYHRAGKVGSEANCHNNALICKRKMMRYTEAHEHARKAYELALSDSAQYASLIASIKINESWVFILEKRYHEALFILQQARTTCEILKDTIQLGFVYYHLGGAYFGLNDFTRARESYLNAWSCLEKRIKPSHTYFADLYDRIGRCSQKNGDPETGLKFLLSARAIYLEMGAEKPDYIAFLQYFGQFYFDENRYEEAMVQFETCLEAKEQYYGKNSRYLLKTLYALGETGIATGRYERAEQCLQRGIQILRDSFEGNGLLTFPYFTQRAALMEKRGQSEACIALCDSAFVMAGFDVENPENFVSRNHGRVLCTMVARAHVSVFEKTGDVHKLQKAEYYFSVATRLLFLEVKEISEESSREIFYDKDHGVIDDWLDARMALYKATGDLEHARVAFQIACQERAFLLSEAMRKSGALQYAGVPESILQSERTLRETIAKAEKARLQNNYLSTNQTDSAALVLNHTLAEARKNHEALMLLIEKNYPDYFHLRHLKNDVSPEVLRRHFLETDQGLLVYSPTSNGVLAFLLTRDTFVAQQLATTPEVGAFNQSLTAYFAESDPDDEMYDQNLKQYTLQAQNWYDVLVRPLEDLLPERLIIVPGGELCYLPFEALLSGPPGETGNWKTYPFWTKQKTLRYALSPDLPVQNKQVAARKTSKPWLGLAPFATDAEGFANRNPTGETFAPLPFSGKEVRTIAAQMHGDCWLNTASGTDRFLREASAYRILHMATHSRADDRQGDYSYLVLSPSGERLPARDLYQYELPADMVVLSSCEAGSGKLINGEGIIGLVRAFTYAGAKSVVASQWVTGDQSSAELMIAFYRFLG